MDRFSALTAFVAVVDQGGFTSAARRLGVAPSSLTRQLNALEAELGTLLLNRSTRSVSLTTAGRTYYQDARRILEQLDEAERAVSEIGKSPSGTLRVTASIAFARLHLAPALPDYLRRFPGVKLDLQLNDSLVNLVDERVDVAIRLATLPDSSLITRKLAHHRRVVCASPRYLEERGVPTDPASLKTHNCLLFDYGGGEDQWTFAREGEVMRVHVQGNLRSTGSEVLLSAALEGVGLVLMPTWLVGGDIAAGRLVILLDNWTAMVGSAEGTISGVFLPNRRGSAKVASFLDYLSDHFGSPPYWEPPVVMGKTAG
ncbi:LysR family transcriptional regulator [Novosphingobium terrae]|uniref:LysR family transcriptional regulator n=1 Tax=Novosphingobium terrae TaxID=2726189 RepID=UPI00197F221F|nr:LysR family transcriptional regulator [Novosphingobium terrae]